MITRIPDDELKIILEAYVGPSSTNNEVLIVKLSYDLQDARAEIERLKESLLCIAVLPKATSRAIADYSDIAIKALNPIYGNIGKRVEVVY